MFTILYKDKYKEKKNGYHSDETIHVYIKCFHGLWVDRTTPNQPNQPTPGRIQSQ